MLEHLEDEHAVLVVDETGFIKKGKRSAGVARQYSGTAGRRENCQMGVFLLYASRSGAAFIDRALYLPEEWTSDRVRCRQAGVPESVEIATKGELVQMLICPSKRNLKRVMKLGNGAVAAHEKAAPDLEADLPYPDPQLIHLHRLLCAAHARSLLK